MYKKLKIFTASFLLFSAIVKAASPFANPDEGMWLLSILKDLNVKEIQKIGLNMTADELYDPNGPSLKDAIVQFGGFCTGEFV